MTKQDIAECIPVLNNIFVKWRWLSVVIITFTVAFGGVAFQTGKIIQNQNDRILQNRDHYLIVEEKIDHLETKIDLLIVQLKNEAKLK